MDANRHQFENSTNWINPYTLQEAIGDIFYNRKEETRSLNELILGRDRINSVLLSGARKIGKSSFLLNLKRFNTPDDLVPIYINLLGAICEPPGYDPLRILSNVAKEILKELETYNHNMGDSLELEGETNIKSFGDFDRFINKLIINMGSRKLLLLFDEFASLLEVINTPLINYLTALAHNNRHIGFVLVMTDAQVRQLKSLGSEELDNLLRILSPISLSQLDEPSARALITKPVPNITYMPGTVERIVDLTGCNPYYIQILCQQIIFRLGRKSAKMVFMEDIETAVRVILETGSNSYFNFQIKDLELDEWHKDVLEALAKAARSKHRFATYVEINNVLGQYGKSRMPEEVEECLDSLVKHSLLVCNRREYKICVGLLQQWLQQQDILTEIYKNKIVRGKGK